MKRDNKIRARLEQRSGLVIPGCFDVLSARQAEAAGFPAVFLSGFATNVAMGRPDGIPGLEAVVSRSRDIAAAIGLPLLVDGDDGHENPAEALRRLEAAGAAGLTIDDQMVPPPVGASRTLVTIEAVQEKIAACRAARTDQEFLIVGRTTAMATHGPEEALRRAKALEDAGADAVMVMYLTEAQQVRSFAFALDAPLFIVVTETARKSFSARELAGAGHAATVYPVTTLLAGLAIQASALAHLARYGDTQALEAGMMHIDGARALAAGHYEDWGKSDRACAGV